MARLGTRPTFNGLWHGPSSPGRAFINHRRHGLAADHRGTDNAANTPDAFDIAAHWRVTILDEGGQIICQPGKRGLYWTCDPPMPHHDWLEATFTGEVRAIIRDVASDGPVADEVRAIVRAKVRDSIGGRRAGDGRRTIH